MLGYEELQYMNLMPSILHALWVHKQGLTSLGRNHKSMMPFKPATWYPCCGTTSNKNYKTTMSSFECSVLWQDEPNTMVAFPPTWHVQQVHVKVWQAGPQSIHWDPVHLTRRSLKLWDRILQELKNNHTIIRVVYVVTRMTKQHECVASHSLCFVWVWIGLDKPGTQSIHWGDVHPRHREPSCRWDL